MNINENKAIENAEPTIKEWAQAGKFIMLPELYDCYSYLEEDIRDSKYSDEEPEFIHKFIIGKITDQVRIKYDITQMQALAIVCFSLKELLEKRNKHE